MGQVQQWNETIILAQGYTCIIVTCKLLLILLAANEGRSSHTGNLTSADKTQQTKLRTKHIQDQ